MALSRRAFLVTGLMTVPYIRHMPVALAGSGEPIELRARPVRRKLMEEGKEAACLAYNGQIPGPMIRARRGERIHVRVINELDQPTTIHWHGIRLDNAMDGVPDMTQPPIAPGEAFDYEFEVPDAGTYWYHPHLGTSEQLDRGMSGPLVVDGDSEDGRFGDDITLLIDDWRLNEDGTISDTFGNGMDMSHAGRLGNWLTVNGVSEPEISVEPGLPVRLRLINASNARILYLDLESLGASVIALDGQPLGKPVTGSGKFALSAAQRADLAILLDRGNSTPFLETSGPPFTFANFTGTPVQADWQNRFPIALKPNDLPEPDVRNASRHVMRLQGGMMGRAFEARMGAMNGSETGAGPGAPSGMMGMSELVGHGMFWALSGVSGTDREPFLSAQIGQSVHITFVNETAWAHGMHIHGHHFRVLTRNGSEEPGTPWRDTVLVGANEKVEIAFVADNPGKWMFHCHMIEHQISGMMTWMSVG